MHQPFPRLTKAILSLVLAFALVPAAPLVAQANPAPTPPDSEVSEPTTPVVQEPGEKPAGEADVSPVPEVPEPDVSAAAGVPGETAVVVPRELTGAPLVQQRPVGFVYLDESVPSVGGTQLVVVGLDDESAALSSAKVAVVSPSGVSLEVAASDYVDNAALFSIPIQEAGTYRLERMDATISPDGKAVQVDLSVREGEPYAFTATEMPAAAARSLSVGDDTVDATVFALSEDGKLEEASSFDEAARLADDAAPLPAPRSARSVARAPAKKFVVALDPGHGGGDPGAVGGVVEKDVNWKISQYCKEALGAYANVEVYVTRSQGENPGLKERVNRAVAAGANVFVSLHVNSSTASSANGAEVWYPNDSSYRYDLHKEGAHLSNKILEKLTALGLTNRGIKVRDSENVNGSGPFYYPDGSIQDYYTVIEASREKGIAAIIVEHAFVSNGYDSNRLKDDSFLRQLGYADAEGIAEAYGLSSSWVSENGRWKLLLADGTYAKNSWQELKGVWYWFGADSYAATGWQSIGAHRFFFDTTCAMQTGWLSTGGTWYYLDGSGAMQTGWLSRGGVWYLLNSKSGAMATGWAKAPDNRWYYFDGSGAMRSGGWLQTGGAWYYLNDSGAMQTGWLSRGGVWYLLDSTSGAMATGWAKAPDNQWYYFDGSGAMQSGGWLKLGSSWYYLSGSGAMQTGWLNSGGAWYLLDATSGAMATGWAKAHDGTWYYFDGSGVMRSGGWFNQGSSWYYLSASGAMQTGWLDLGGKRYYLHESGAMATGTQTIDGVSRRFDASGACQNPPGTEALITIQGAATVTPQALAQAYARGKATYPTADLAKGGAPTIQTFCQILYEESVAEGIRPELVWSQVMKETGWLRFGGDVKIKQFNFGGLGATGGGEPGNSFKDVRTGLRAQVQHLKCYASNDPLNQAKVDPRWWDALRSTAPYVQWLGIKENPSGKGWAAAPNYGYNLADMMRLYFGVK